MREFWVSKVAVGYISDNNNCNVCGSCNHSNETASYIKWTNPGLRLNNAKAQRKKNVETAAAVSAAVVHSEVGQLQSGCVALCGN